MATAKKAPAKKASARAASATRAPARKTAPSAGTVTAKPVKKASGAPGSAKKATAVKGSTKKPAAAPTKKAAAGGAATKAAPRKAAPRKAAPKKAAPKKAAPKKSPFDAKFLQAQREVLLEERATLEEQASVLKAEADSLTFDREPGDVQFDDESGEGDTLAVERDFDLARAAQAQHTIDEIDDALRRIDRGTYGICEYSGEPIPRERLRAIPWARERVEYKTRSFR